jgi:hypothetical protein
MFGFIKQTINSVFTNKSVIYVLEMIGFYLLWIVIHYVSANLYAEYCAKKTIVGFLISPFVSTMPHCKTLRWFIYQGGNSIEAMWFIIGGMIFKRLIPIQIPTTTTDATNDTNK